MRDAPAHASVLWGGARRAERTASSSVRYGVSWRMHTAASKARMLVAGAEWIVPGAELVAVGSGAIVDIIGVPIVIGSVTSNPPRAHVLSAATCSVTVTLVPLGTDAATLTGIVSTVLENLGSSASVLEAPNVTPAVVVVAVSLTCSAARTLPLATVRRIVPDSLGSRMPS